MCLCRTEMSRVHALEAVGCASAQVSIQINNSSVHNHIVKALIMLDDKTKETQHGIGMKYEHLVVVVSGEFTVIRSLIR